MLTAKNRLRKKKEFLFVYRRGEAFHSKYFSLFVCSTKLKNSKIGISVGSKVGNSVVRHKIKRRMTEILRKKIATLPQKNYVFVAKTGVEDLTFDELCVQVEYILQKAVKKE